MQQIQKFLLVSLLFSLLAFWVTQAAADDPRVQGPVSISNDLSFIRTGAAVWGHAVAVSSTSDCVRTSTGTGSTANHCQFFPWRAQVIISCTETTVFCWLMDPEGPTIATSGWVEDDATTDGANGTGGDGVGACFEVVADAPGVYAFPIHQAFQERRSVGRRVGRCTGTVNAEIARWPCDEDDDCVYGNMSCDTDAGFNVSTGGAFLWAVSSVSGSCFVTVPR